MLQAEETAGAKALSRKELSASGNREEACVAEDILLFSDS